MELTLKCVFGMIFLDRVGRISKFSAVTALSKSKWEIFSLDLVAGGIDTKHYR